MQMAGMNFQTRSKLQIYYFYIVTNKIIKISSSDLFCWFLQFFLILILSLP
ncbi:hypothetical protein [Robinsoniella peoriensis]